jgi:cytochrome P450
VVTAETQPRAEKLARAGIGDTLGAVRQVILPTINKGVIVRRPKVVALAERLDLDRRAVRRMQKLRAKYGGGPLILPVPGRPQALILSPDHVHRILQGAPEPFAPATAEKRASLAHFEPAVSLISEPPERTERRRFNEEVLQSRCAVHDLGDRFMQVVDEEARELLSRASDELDWDAFIVSWFHVVRRVVLGDGARDDHELTGMLEKLRRAANWAFLHPGRRKLREQFLERLRQHLARAEEGSLAARIAATPQTADTAPANQVAHYLFAFDPGGMASFRALALLAAHPDQARRAREEIGGKAAAERSNLPLMRSAILESLRLWPTTPIILRETTEETEWDGGTMAKKTHIIIYAPYFHRDDESLPYAHRFEPDIWLAEEPGGGWPLIPFSGGPGICPARNLVPMLGSAMIAAIMEARSVELAEPERLSADRPMPGTLDNYSLRFRLGPLAA